MKTILFGLLTLFILTSCNSKKMSETKISQFEGNWKLEGRQMFEGIEIKISNDGKDNLVGIITKINDNKFVKMFMTEGDKFTTSITRNSNFQFTLKEKKIASDLFSVYGQNTTAEYKVEFENNDKINLGQNDSEGHYIRIK